MADDCKKGPVALGSGPSLRSESLEHFVKDVNEIFSRAMEQGNFSVALKAKELLAKTLGFFRKNEDRKSIKDFSEEEIQLLIEEIEEFYKDRHQKDS